MIEYVTFQSFYTEEEAQTLAGVLQQHDIASQIIKSKFFDKIYSGETSEKPIHLNIKNSDFKKANEVLENLAETNLTHIDKDYYLYSFSDAELLDIISKQDEWSKQDFVIARKILKERGIDIQKKDIEEIKSKRTAELSKYEEANGSYIFIGYALAIMPALFLIESRPAAIYTVYFGIIALFFGLSYMQAKKVLPDGKKGFVYNEKTRFHGKLILITSCIVLLAYVAKLYFPDFF